MSQSVGGQCDQDLIVRKCVCSISTKEAERREQLQGASSFISRGRTYVRHSSNHQPVSVRVCGAVVEAMINVIAVKS